VSKAEPIWVRPEPGSRRPSLSRELIARTAMRLADEEGLKAVSMRRIAEALGVGTMTLYHYVRTKDDLYALMDDAMMAELVLDDDELPAGDWRAALTAIATRSRDVQRRHPWVLEALGGLTNRIGPHGMRHFEQSLAATADTGLDREGRLDLVGFVDEYVFGYSVRAVLDAEAADSGWFEHVSEYVEAQLETGEFPHIAGLFEEGEDRRETWRRLEALQEDESRFQRGLDRLLDGVALELERRGLGSPPR
jgi:AcrR family transcriptional regulator